MQIAFEQGGAEWHNSSVATAFAAASESRTNWIVAFAQSAKLPFTTDAHARELWDAQRAVIRLSSPS
jgi:hypothetical protein